MVIFRYTSDVKIKNNVGLMERAKVFRVLYA